jgi:hypothetical protein
MVVGVLGSGVALAPAVASALSGGPVAAALREPPESNVALALLAPLGPGHAIAGLTIIKIRPLEEGGVTVALQGEGGSSLELEILARDTSPLTSRPPAQTNRFAVYVRNGGDGASPTALAQGLAAMELAKVIAHNEASVDTRGFLTHAERIALHRASMLKVGTPKRRSR